MEARTLLIILMVAAALVPVWTLCCLWAGFRMGRTVAGFTPEPIIKPKEENFVDQDPYFEAMHGYPQDSIPTVEGRT